jgi:putative drug exporter of the RND superfamily
LVAVLTRLGRLAYRWRLPVALAWLAVLVLGAVFGGRVFDRLGDVEGLRPDAESVVAETRIDQLVPEGPMIVAVVEGRDVFDPAFVASVTKVAGGVSALHGVAEVNDPFSAPGGQLAGDKRGTVIRVELRDDLAPARQERLEDDVIASLRAIDAPTVLIGGESLAERAFAEQAVRDLARGEGIALPLLFAALLVVFGGLAAASLPLVVALTAVSGTLLAMLALVAVTPASEYSVNVVTLLGLGLAVDYSLLLVARFREERAKGLDPPAAVERSVATAGRAVLVSGLTVAAALAALLAFAEPLLNSLALAGAAVALLAALVTITLVPALLGFWGRRIPPAGSAPRWAPWRRLVERRAAQAADLDREPPRRPPPPRSRGGRAATSVARTRRGAGGAGQAAGRNPRGAGRLDAPGRLGLLARLARTAQRRPWPVALGVTAGLLLLALPFTSASLEDSGATALPASSEPRRVLDLLESRYNLEPDPVTVVAEADDGDPAMVDFLNRLNMLPSAARLELRPDVPDGATVIDLTPEGRAAGPDARALVRAARDLDAPFPFRVAGPAAEVVDYQASVVERLPLAAAILLLATTALLFSLTGSLVVPAKAIVMNLLSLGATLGILKLVFQDGWFAGVLGFEPAGALDLTTPVLLFVLTFGLSTDYEVFLLSRIKEAWERSGDSDWSVLAGLERSGRVVTAAAVCIAIVFLGFAAGDLLAVKELGVGMTIAVLLDVTIVRGLLLPAVMTLMAERNWWPARQPQPRPS